MVVISLVTIMLLFAVPNFSGYFISDNTAKTLRWVMVKVKHLKARAVSEQKYYILHADMDSGRLWITNESMMTEEDEKTAIQNAFTLPDDVRLMDVEFPQTGKVTAGVAEIIFYKRGFSDRAVIHIEGSVDKRKSLFVEPFLSNVEVLDTYESY